MNVETITAPEKPAEAPAPRRKGILHGFFFWALSLFLLGMGMKLLMMQRSINPLPYFDQWEAEAIGIYIPYYENALRFADLFRPQNEHRIFFTHVYDLALLLLNKQWDSQLQMVVNAMIHSGTVALFAWLMAVLMDRRYWLFIWLPLALTIMSPFGWENALWGFQSQFYFLLMFSLLSIWLLTAEPLTRQWYWGVAAAACALLTMASGLLASVAVGAIATFEILKSPREWRRHLPTLGVCIVLAFAGLLLENRDFDEKFSAAHSFKDFFMALGNNLSWPTGLWPWLAPLNLFPLALLAWIYFRSKEKSQPVERIVLGIGAWAILQSIATAIARGIGGVPPTWRYMDTLCFLLTANILSAALLFWKYRENLWLRPVLYALFAVWLIPCAASLWGLNDRAWNTVIPLWARCQTNRVAMTRAFLASNDESAFAAKDYRDLPWVYVPGLVYLLRDKDVIPILPVCARFPLKVISKDNAASAFIPRGSALTTPDPATEYCLGSYSKDGAAARGTFESAPLTSSLPYLQIQVAGNLGQPGLSLDLVDLASGKVTAVKPARKLGGQWTNVDVKAPPGQFKLVARDDSATGWFAFKEPREMGRLSFWAERLIAIAKYVLITGIISFAVALFSYCFLRDKNQNVSSQNIA